MKKAARKKLSGYKAHVSDCRVYVELLFIFSKHSERKKPAKSVHVRGGRSLCLPITRSAGLFDLSCFQIGD